MRMWMVPPESMCRQHLLGEHYELHKFVGSMAKKKNLSEYLKKGYLDGSQVGYRHFAIMNEMIKRGYNHNSPLKSVCTEGYNSIINVRRSIEELSRRCPECRKKIKKHFVFVNIKKETK